LLSGGLDSATALAIACAQGYASYALSVDYGQRHAAELDAARRVARSCGVREHRTMRVDLSGIGGSALTDPNIPVPNQPTDGIPVTYVPARNTIMLSLALAWAEVLVRVTCSSASTFWTPAVTRTAAPSSSQPLLPWLRSPPRRAWRAQPAACTPR
jgi:queuosine biosynthesis protein QueC